MSIFVAVPSYTPMRAETVGSLATLMCELQKGLPDSLLHIFANCADIRMARSEQVSQFFPTKCEDFLFIDNDIAFEAALIARMHLLDADIVVAGYKKRLGNAYALRLLEGLKNPIESPMRIVGGERVIEILSAGLGCTLIKRRVLETIRDRYPELMYVSEITNLPCSMMFQSGIYEVDGVRRALGEDFAFCLRARECGFKVECLVDAEIDHAGVQSCLGTEFFPAH